MSYNEHFDETIWADALTDVPPAKKGKRKKKARKRKKFKFSLFLAFTFLFILFSFMGYKISCSLLSGDATESDISVVPPAAADTGIGEPILLLGVDRRGKEPSRSDTIILAVVDDKKDKVDLISIPRDTRTKIPGRGETKINHAFAYGGPELTLEALNNLLDSDVEKYVIVDFEGFVNIIDILGGVEYDVEKRMYYPAEKINLRAGKQVLDGDKALQYVRFRSDGAGDIGRIERQQKFLKAVAKEALSVANIIKVPSLVKECYKSIDTNLSIKEMVSLAKQLSSLDSENVNTITLPGEPSYIRGISYWIPEDLTLKELLEDTEEKLDDTEEENDGSNE